jgi:hypothetical protein
MLENIQIFLLSILAVGGALFLAALGWLDSGEPFNGRKFASSILRAVVAGLIFAFSTYSGVDTILNGWMYVAAFLGGMGIDAAGNRISAAITVGNGTTKPTEEPLSPEPKPIPDVITYSEWAYTPGLFVGGTAEWMRRVYRNQEFIGQQTATVDPRTNPDTKITSTVIAPAK